MQKRAFDYTQSIPLIVSSAEDTDDPNNDKEKNEPVHLIKGCFAFPSEARIILPPHKMDISFIANFGTLSEHEARLWSDWAAENCVESRMRESDGAWQLLGLMSTQCDAVNMRRKLRTIADKWGSPLPAKLGHGWLKVISADEFHAISNEEDARKDVLPPSDVESAAHRNTSAACHRTSDLRSPILPQAPAVRCGASVLSPTFADAARERLQLLLAT